jgi:xanthine dehydrogenase accessory factor
MGSRRHIPGFAGRLRDEGFDLGRLRSPTGLDVGARTPPEIALSILAEVLAAGRGRAGGSLDVVNAIAGRPVHGSDGLSDDAAAAASSAAGG